MMKFNKEFREAHPETIGETDSAFDMANYAEWLEQELVKKNDLLQLVVHRRELLLAAICEYNKLNTQKDIKAVDDWLEKWDSK